MDRKSSPISDMYGVSPDDRVDRRKDRTWLYVLLILAGFFLLQSIQPVMRLRPDPPEYLMGVGLAHGGLAGKQQLQIAGACWDYAVTSLQKVFPYGRDLPVNPPASLMGRPGDPSAIGVQCWPRLREAWSQPESWVRSYRWSTEWITDPDGPVQGAVSHLLHWLGIRTW